MNRAVFLFAFLTLVSAGLFVADLLGAFNVAQRPVAYLDASRGTVRRLANEQLTWDHAQKGTLFGSGDTISTGEVSKAKLVFYAGGELELDAGAMVVLAENLDELRLNFLRGGGRVRVAKNVKSQISGNSRVKVAKVEKVAVAARPAKVTSVVEQAPVSAASPDRAPGSAPSGTGEVATAAAPVSVSSSAVTEASPAPSSVSEVAATTVATTAASPGPSDATAAVTAAASASPAPLSETAAAAGDGFGEDSAADGLALAPARKESEVRDLKKTLAAESKGEEIMTATKLPPAPKLSYPSGDAVVDLGKEKAPLLKWEIAQSEESAGEDLSYEVVLRPAEGDGPEKILKTAESSLALNRLGRGKYLWSVRSINSKGKRGPTSETRWLEVKVPAQIAKPKLLPVKVE